VDIKLPAWLDGKRAAVNESEFAATEARHSYEAQDVSLEARIRTEYVSNFMNVVDYELMAHESATAFQVAPARLEEMTAMEMRP